jgi:PAS domain S-box-containing protein
VTSKLRRPELLLTLVALVIFGADLALPSERAFVVLFALVVIMAGRLLPRARHVAVTAALCAGLTIIGYVLRHGAGIHPDYLVRRLVALMAIAIVAALTIRNQRLEHERREKAALLDLTGDATFVRNAAGIITAWSRGAHALYGWSSRQALGRHAGATLGPEDQCAAAAAHTALLRDGRWEGELVHRTRDDRHITVMSHWALQRDQRGTVQAILETNTDITQSRIAEAEIRRSEERYRRIFHTTGAAIWEEDYAAVLPLLADLHRAGVRAFEPYFLTHPDIVLAALAKVRVVDVNQTAVTMFGATDKADLLASLDRVFLPETLPSFAMLLAALAEGRASCEAETTVQTLQGETREILMSVVFPRGEEPVTNVIVSIMDTTDRNVPRKRYGSSRPIWRRQRASRHWAR